MKTMRLDEGTVQAGEGGARVLLPVCVCGSEQEAPSAASPAAEVLTCATCGGSPLRALAPGQRPLQDFLSAFV